MMAAVIHHGGAGTTAAGLRYGKPTFICPFFGDQFMWGAMIHRSGVGPEPCPVQKLTVEILSQKLAELQSKKYKDAASVLSSKMLKEDGIQGGLDHFLSDLPIDNMLCDVSLIMGETRKAKFKLGASEIKLSMEVASFIETSNLIINSFGIKRLIVKPYDLGYVDNCFEGYRYGVYGSFYYFIAAFYRLFKLPDRYARTHGAFGCLFGLLLAPFYFLFFLGRSMIIFIDRLGTGICNGCCNKRYTYLCDSGIAELENIKVTKSFQDEMTALRASELSRSRKYEIRRALELAMNARIVFRKANPFFQSKCVNYRVVYTKDLIEAISSHTSFQKKKLVDLSSLLVFSHKGKGTVDEEDSDWGGGEIELTKIREALEKYGEDTISFSKFCLVLQYVIDYKPPTKPEITGDGLHFEEIYNV